jgi:hypothetical protein
MAIFMGNKVAVVAGTTTITSFVSTVSLNREVEAVTITAMNDTIQNMIGGVEISNVTLELFNDFAAGSVNSIFEDAIGTKLALKFIPVSGTVSTTNPSYSMSCLITNWTPINGSTGGEAATASVTFPVTALTKSTSV